MQNKMALRIVLAAIGVFYGSDLFASVARATLSGTCTSQVSGESPKSYVGSADVNFYFDRSAQRYGIGVTAKNSGVTVSALMDLSGRFDDYSKLPPKDLRQFHIQGRLEGRKLKFTYGYSGVWGTPYGRAGYPDREGFAGHTCEFSGNVAFELPPWDGDQCCTECFLGPYKHYSSIWQYSQFHARRDSYKYEPIVRYYDSRLGGFDSHTACNGDREFRLRLKWCSAPCPKQGKLQ